MRRNKAGHSLDEDNGIETAVISVIGGYIPDPETAVCMMERHCSLCCALNSLPEIQGRRVEARYILGKSVKEIAEAEGVSENSVNVAIKHGLVAMRKFLQNSN